MSLMIDVYGGLEMRTGFGKEIRLLVASVDGSLGQSE